MKHSGSLEDALALIAEKFRGVQDKAGQPYVLHLLRVALANNDPEARIAGLLHDVIEDTETSIEELRSCGFSERVLEAVDRLTHCDSDTYTDYVVRIHQNPLAIACKLADLRDNYQLDRVAYRADHAEEDAIRIQRYILSFQYLTDQIDEPSYRKLMRAVEK